MRIMSNSAISLGLGLGGGKAATSSGRPAGGGIGPIQNLLSAQFDGTDDYLDLGSSTTYANTASAFSVSLWFKFDTFSNYPGLCLLKTNHSGLVIGTSQLSVYKGVWFGSAPSGTTNGFKGFSTNSSSVASSIASGWHHLVFTYDGVDDQAASSFGVYIDGSVVTCNFAVGIGTYSNVNYIGYGGAGHLRFDGLIDEFAIFDSALSAENVTAIYNSGTPPNISSLSPVGWWRMGDGTGDTDSGGGTPADGDTIGTVVDQGSGGNNATGTNGPTFSSTTPS